MSASFSASSSIPSSDSKANTKSEDVDEKSPAGLRVLVADDNAGNYAVAADLLKKHGHLVTPARDGREAIELYKAGPFDLVLMDVQMPVLNGFSATAQIRDLEEQSGHRTPIVAMTGRAFSRRPGILPRCGDGRLPVEAAAEGKAVCDRSRPPMLLLLAHFSGSERDKDKNEAEQQAPVKRAPDISSASFQIADSTAGKLEACATFTRAQLLEELDGDEELLEQLGTLFREGTPRILSEIEAAITQQDAPNLVRSVGDLLSSLGVFGAREAHQLARELEQMALAKQFTNASEVFAKLEAVIKEVLGAIDSLLGISA